MLKSKTYTCKCCSQLFETKSKKPANYCSNRCRVMATDLWKLDQHKIKVANEHGYQVHVVWESDFKQNKKQVVEQCLNFLTA